MGMMKKVYKLKVRSINQRQFGVTIIKEIKVNYKLNSGDVLFIKIIKVQRCDK